MLFTLTTTRGHTFKFTVLSCAQIYQSIYGGKVVAEWRESAGTTALMD